MYRRYSWPSGTTSYPCICDTLHPESVCTMCSNDRTNGVINHSYRIITKIKQQSHGNTSAKMNANCKCSCESIVPNYQLFPNHSLLISLKIKSRFAQSNPPPVLYSYSQLQKFASICCEINIEIFPDNAKIGRANPSIFHST